MTLQKVAERINVHLRKFESDPVINADIRGTTLRPFYHAGAGASGRYVMVCYVSYQGSRGLSKSDAEAYLAWLDAGNVGTHYKALR